MLIVADRNIPQVEEAFTAIGEVRLVDGRGLNALQLQDADILLVRSVTPVNAKLLSGSKVRFVGSATIGIDHIDLEYLRSSGIEFAYAPGSSAQAVAEYVLSAILALHAGRVDIGTVGIIGYGNTGSRLARLLDVLGIEYLLNDPPLADSGTWPDREFVSLADIKQADIISLHVPLTAAGPYPTHHLIDAGFMHDMPRHTLLINTARGAVVDNVALLAHLQNTDSRAVLDVWEGEPAINIELLQQVTLGTPHIAGYSLEGRLNGTRQIYLAVCNFLRVPSGWNPAPVPAQTLHSTLEGFAAVRALVRQAYDIRRDDTQLRTLLQLPVAERAPGFDRLRRDYPPRCEFSSYRFNIQTAGDVQAQLRGLGFAPESAP